MRNELQPRRAAPARPLERAQRLWQRAVAVASTGDGAPLDRFEIALDLLHTAGDDLTTIAHARAIGQTQLRANPDDPVARRSVQVLEDAITSLGAKPPP